MRIVNERFENIDEYDLTKGKLLSARAIREDAKPVDNFSKYAWDDDDWEDVMMYIIDPIGETQPTMEDRLAALEEENKQLKEALDLLLSGETEEGEADG